MAVLAATTYAQARRWLATGALITGGALAIAATFLPLGQAAYPAIEGERAVTFTDIPAHDLTFWLVDMLRAPYRLSISTLLWAFLLWGAPAILAAMGLALLWARRWRPASGSVFVGLVLVAIGAGVVALSCVGYLHPYFGSQGAARSLLYGPAVSLLGYLLALTGTLMLPAVARAPR